MVRGNLGMPGRKLPKGKSSEVGSWITDMELSGFTPNEMLVLDELLNPPTPSYSPTSPSCPPQSPGGGASGPQYSGITHWSPSPTRGSRKSEDARELIGTEVIYALEDPAVCAHPKFVPETP